MPKLSDLKLGSEQLATPDFETMPDQRGGFGPLPQPGTYRFALPKFHEGSPIFDTIKYQDLDRLNIVFEDAFALTIVQSPGGGLNGASFDWRVSNVAFNRARRGEPEVKVSDMDYLLRDVFAEPSAPKTNLGYAQAMIRHAGTELTADLEFTWRCDERRDIYVEDGQGGYSQVEGQKGCGAKYFQGGKEGVQKVLSNPDDPQSLLVYPERITCNGKDGVPCGAVIRAYPRLRNFRK